MAQNGTEHHTADLKKQIIEALSHAEAEDGLYFRNLYHHHEEDERPVVRGDELSILAALYELIDEGKVKMHGEGDEATFHLVPR